MRTATSALVLLALAACQYDPYAHEFTSVPPDSSKLPGRYIPDRETRERLATALNVKVPATCELLVRADGTFAARDLPHCWFGQAFDCAPGTVNFEGHWRVAEDQEWWAMHLDAERIDGIKTSFGLPATIRGDEAPYILHLTIGDPDVGNALAFERASP